MTIYKPRSAWTSSGRGGARLTGSKLVGIAWHWPGTSRDVIGVESEAQVANRLRGYRNFHVGSRGWSDIGYNFAVDQAGRVWDLRGLGRVGAHAASTSNPDANHEWMGVLLILGDRERPSAAMIRACQDFRADVLLRRWPGRTRDTGHGRAPGVPGAQTSCPGPFAAELIVDGVLTDQPQEMDDMPTAKEIADEILDQVLAKVDETSGTGPRMRVKNFIRWIHEHAAKSRGGIEQTIIPQLAAVRSEQAANRELLVQLAAQQSGVQLNDEQISQLAQQIAEAGQGACDQVLERLAAAGDALDGDPDA